MIKNIAEKYEETLKKKNRTERMEGIFRKEDLIETYKPITDATQEQTNVLKNELKSLEKTSPGMNALDFYLNQYTGKLDPYFRIYKDGDKYILGDKQINIEDNNIYVDGQKFQGSTGLWALIMENTPNLDNVTEETIESYAELMKLTHAFEIGAYGSQNARRTEKFQFLTQLFNIKKGLGISFLPSDINSLHDRLKILLAEFNAGNRATRNEIVAIVDNLNKRKQIGKTEAKDITNYLQNADH